MKSDCLLRLRASGISGSVLRAWSALLFLIIILSTPAHSASKKSIVNSSPTTSQSNQPYIDEIKQELKEKEASNLQNKDPDELQAAQEKKASYTSFMKKELDKNDARSGVDRTQTEQNNQPYIDQIKHESPELFSSENNEPSKGYTKTLKAQLGPKHEESAIKAYKEGHSDLDLKIDTNIRHAFGMKYGVSLNSQISANSTTEANSFNSVYGGNYVPSLYFQYEYQPFHHERWGSIGFFGLSGISYFKGTGLFDVNLSTASGSTISSGSSGTGGNTVNFQFFTVPLTLGVSYRFNLLHILRPYIMVGPSLIGYQETRSDTGNSMWGHSQGYQAVVGVAILMDWISDKAAWEAYTSLGVKHSYLTIDYMHTGTFSGDVNFNLNGIYAGFVFER